jgi:hypothetical protein
VGAGPLHTEVPRRGCCHVGQSSVCFASVAQPLHSTLPKGNYAGHILCSASFMSIYCPSFVTKYRTQVYSCFNSYIMMMSMYVARSSVWRQVVGRPVVLSNSMAMCTAQSRLLYRGSSLMGEHRGAPACDG